MTSLITDKPSSREVDDQGVLSWVNREALKFLVAFHDRINKLITRNEEPYEVGDSGTAATVDWSESHVATMTLTDNATLTFTAPDGDVLLRLVVDVVGAYTITWPADVEWSNGIAAPVLAGGNILVLLQYIDGVGYIGTY